MMGTGMMAAGAAIQAIQQTTVKLTVSDGKLKAPGLTGNFTAGNIVSGNGGHHDLASGRLPPRRPLALSASPRMSRWPR